MKLFLTIVLLTLASGYSTAELNPQAYGLLKSMYAHDQTYPLNFRAVGSTRRDE